MSTKQRALDTRELEERVKDMYREVAEEPFNEFHFQTGRQLAERLGYPSDQLDAIPPPSIDSFAGVGYYFDLAAITAGETVVDLGSGSGTDSFLAANQTGSDGRVIGSKTTGKKPCSGCKSPPSPGEPGDTKTGLSRRRSRVRVPSLPFAARSPPLNGHDDFGRIPLSIAALVSHVGHSGDGRRGHHVTGSAQ